MKPKIFRALRDMAKRVGLNIQREFIEGDTTPIYWLMDGKGERLCSEYEDVQMLKSLFVYAGSHPDYKEALADFKTTLG